MGECVCVCEYVLCLFLCEYWYVPSIPAHVVCVRMFLYNIQCCVEFVVHCVLSFLSGVVGCCLATKVVMALHEVHG